MSQSRRILVVGGGSIGERHIRCFLRTGKARVSLCDVNNEVRDRLSAAYPLAEVYDDFDDVLSSPPDAAVICTPAHLHIAQALRLAEAGVHLLIEKPLSVRVTEELDHLEQLVQERGLSVAVAYVMRSHPALGEMRQALIQGRFGPPVEVVANSGQHFPLYRPAYREIYYTDRATGGGAIQDALTHVVNAAQWLVGPMTKLAADADHLVLDGVSVEDTAHVIARHQDVMACYSLNQHQAPNESTLTVVCRNGAMRFESHRHRWLSATEPGEPWQEEATFDLQRDDLFVRQAEAFLDVLENKSPPPCTLSEGRQTLLANLAILRAVETRKWVEVGSLS